jgi:hypothetical protein
VLQTYQYLWAMDIAKGLRKGTHASPQPLFFLRI